MVMRLMLLFTCVLLWSCSDSDGDQMDVLYGEVDLLGIWQLNGVKISAGGPLPEDFITTDFYQEFSFATDGTYTILSGTSRTVFSKGDFSVIEDELRLNPKQGQVPNKSAYNFWFEGESLVLSPSSPILCIEGCLYRYEKQD